MRIRIVLALTLAVSACFGDPPPDAEVLPLEIVVHPEECLINYPNVGPGTHEVTVIFEGTSGAVRIVGAGETVFSSEAGTSGSADLVAGDYQVECETDGVIRQIALLVRDGLPPGGG